MINGILACAAIVFYATRAYKFTDSIDKTRVRHVSMLLVEVSVLATIVTQMISPHYGQMPLREKIPEGFLYFAAVIALAGSAFSSWARIHMGKNWHTSWAENPPKKLVTTGPFKFIRHPVYSGTWLFALGFELALWNWLLLGILPAALILDRAASREESNLQKQFSEQWDEYVRRTKRFIPRAW